MIITTWVSKIRSAWVRGRKKQATLDHLHEQREIGQQAREAFDRGRPVDDRPPFATDEMWKATFWHQTWMSQKAFREGQAAQKNGLSIKDNPYRPEYHLRFDRPDLQTTLFTYWNRGYQHPKA